MNTPLISRALRASLVLGLSALPFTAALTARADAPTSSASSDTVLVPRLVKGAQTAERVRVPASQFNANGFRVERSRGNCPGTICPRTRTCYDVKGALGANCIQAPRSASRQASRLTS